MREIRFRAWDNVNKRMCYFQPGFEWNDEYDLWYLSPTDWSKRVSDVPFGDNINLMQFTGLKDKNGKEIYDGDILKYSDSSDSSHHKIFFDEKYGRWFDERLEDGDSQTAYDDFSFVTECKIVGNIYQNPEWL